MMPFDLAEFLLDPMRVRTIEPDPQMRVRVPMEAHEWNGIVVVRWRGFTPIAYGEDRWHLLRLA